ncbi:DUF4843 domain-containing protein [Marinilabiliaceae bacterium JC017]|nr:DUF4843 domain-containing protein [Marinilabiliaceae bacterium JC017]
MKLFSKYIFLLLLGITPFLGGCEVEDFSDWTQESTIIRFDEEVYSASFLKVDGEVAEKQDDLAFNVFGKKLDFDVKINFEVVEEGTTAKPDQYEIKSTEMILPAGQTKVVIPIIYHKENLPNGKAVDVMLKIKSVSNNLRLIDTPVKLTMLKGDFNIAQFIGKYDFAGDGWVRDFGELKRTEDPFVYEMYGFWGSKKWMTCKLDISDKNAIKLIIPTGTKLDDGWDEKGAWWFATDCIGVLDYDKSIINYIQFDYKCDNGVTGSFPYCEKTCQMIKK